MNKIISKNRTFILISLFIFGSAFLLGISSGLAAENNGALIFLSPASGTSILEDSFSVEVKLDTKGSPINASQLTLYFPSDKLEVINISKTGSIFTLWAEEPAFSNSSGEISFAGGLPHPGFKGVGSLLTISFKAKNKGMADIGLGEARVLANDGMGTDILTFIKEAKYSVVDKIIPLKGALSSPLIFSSTHLQPKEWYNNNNPRFEWQFSSDITGVSFVLDRKSDTLPDTISEGIISYKNYENIEDGVWYFHLRAITEEGWGSASHYKIQVDTRPPNSFDVIVDNKGDNTNPNPELYFETQDDGSGVHSYKFKIGEQDFLDLMLAQVNPFSLFNLSPGRYLITVRAKDKAGNNVEVKSAINVEAIKSPEISVWPRLHTSGEETFYIEGKALPEAKISIFLRKDEQLVKEWLAEADRNGEWSFSTKELIKSGIYYISAQAEDNRGAVSGLSDSHKIEVLLNGLSLGPFLISLKTLTLFLFLVGLLGIIVIGYFIYKTWRTKKILRKETQDTRNSLKIAFNVLREELKEKIELFDSKPGFSKKEKEVYNNLKKSLDISEKFISKEIEDVEKELE